MRRGRPKERSQNKEWIAIHATLAEIFEDMEIFAYDESICWTYAGNLDNLKRKILKVSNIIEMLEEKQNAGLSK